MFCLLNQKARIVLEIFPTHYLHTPSDFGCFFVLLALKMADLYMLLLCCKLEYPGKLQSVMKPTFTFSFTNFLLSF